MVAGFAVMVPALFSRAIVVGEFFCHLFYHGSCAGAGGAQEKQPAANSIGGIPFRPILFSQIPGMFYGRRLVLLDGFCTQNQTAIALYYGIGFFDGSGIRPVGRQVAIWSVDTVMVELPGHEFLQRPGQSFRQGTHLLLYS